MAKAFTEEERSKIKEKIMEAALDLFHDKGTKALSIRELTKRAGIAQGSFYNFWQDKEALILELATYRSMQKLNQIEEEFSRSLPDPAGFLSDVIYHYSLDLLLKIKHQPVYREAFRVLEEKSKSERMQLEHLYGQFLDKLISYWQEHCVIRQADRRGLTNAFIGSFVLCSNWYQFPADYFNEVLRIYIMQTVKRYLKTEKGEGANQ